MESTGSLRYTGTYSNQTSGTELNTSLSSVRHLSQEENNFHSFEIEMEPLNGNQKAKSLGCLVTLKEEPSDQSDSSNPSPSNWTLQRPASIEFNTLTTTGLGLIGQAGKARSMMELQRAKSARKVHFEGDTPEDITRADSEDGCHGDEQQDRGRYNISRGKEIDSSLARHQSLDSVLSSQTSPIFATFSHNQVQSLESISEATPMEKEGFNSQPTLSLSTTSDVSGSQHLSDLSITSVLNKQPLRSSSLEDVSSIQPNLLIYSTSVDSLSDTTKETSGTTEIASHFNYHNNSLEVDSPLSPKGPDYDTGNPDTTSHPRLPSNNSYTSGLPSTEGPLHPHITAVPGRPSCSSPGFTEISTPKGLRFCVSVIQDTYKMHSSLLTHPTIRQIPHTHLYTENTLPQTLTTKQTIEDRTICKNITSPSFHDNHKDIDWEPQDVVTIGNHQSEDNDFMELGNSLSASLPSIDLIESDVNITSHSESETMISEVGTKDGLLKTDQTSWYSGIITDTFHEELVRLRSKDLAERGRWLDESDSDSDDEEFVNPQVKLGRELVQSQPLTPINVITRDILPTNYNARGTALPNMESSFGPKRNKLVQFPVMSIIEEEGSQVWSDQEQVT